jgi:ABC-type lipoprotein release transport system permease subunit
MRILRRIRRESRRYGAIGGIVLLAVTSFVVLTGSAASSRLTTTETIDSAFQPAYDILVRPRGSTSSIEKQTGRVRPNYLSGIFGGITTRQAEQIAAIRGVDVSAPIAMLGQVLETVDYPVDVTGLVGQRGDALLRFRTTDTTMRGLASTEGAAGYLYVSHTPVARDLAADDAPVTGQIGGRTVPLCRNLSSGAADSAFDPINRWSAQCWDRQGGRAGEDWPAGTGTFQIDVRFSFPVMLAAVDPRAEAELTGLDDAVVQGRYLTEEDRPDDTSGGDSDVPVLASSVSFVDELATIDVDRLGQDAIAGIQRGLSFAAAKKLVESASGAPVDSVGLDQNQIHRQWLDHPSSSGQAGILYPRLLFTSSTVDYDQSDGALVPREVPPDDSVWRTRIYSNEPFAAVPPDASDTGYRTITAIPAHIDDSTGQLHQVRLATVGEFDPRKISTGSKLSEVPLETYQPPTAEAADPQTAELLGDQSLLPDTNPAGYLQSPPLLLTTLSAVSAFTDGRAFDYSSAPTIPTAPISVVRVRVAGVTGADALSRERIRLVAEQIRERTGLDVDITTGSSPHPTRVVLPATAHGAPSLTVDENWVDKGVATVLLAAIDRKSLALFILILLTSAVAVAISATAAIRARRTQLGILSCLGWRPWTLVREVVGELLVVGLAAGAAGALLSIPVSLLLGTDVSPWRALVAVPGAVLVVLFAGVVPAVTAARATPGDALRAAVRPPRRASRLRGTASLALSYVRRTPGRAVAAASTLALAVATLTILAGIVFAFHDAVVGTVLGNAVSVQVRKVDVVAAILLAVLGLGSLADILYLDIKEQAPRYASLQAAGWRDRTLGALIVYQAVILGVAGAVIGAAAGLVGLRTVTTLNAEVWLCAAAVAVLAVLASAVVALLPASSLRRLPTAVLLAQESS